MKTKLKVDPLNCLYTIGIIGSLFVLPALSKNIQSIGRRSESNICPSLSGWEGRSQVLCSSDQSMYHCLLTRDDYYLEACISAIFVEPGFFPRISEELDRLYKEACPSDMYQPEREMSNRFKKVKCTYMKAKCDGLGEKYCNNGSTTQDVECRCDYLKGYRSDRYFLGNPERKSCYTKKEEDGCFMYPCSNSSEELNPAYQCVPVCAYGYYRPPYEFNCIPNKTTSVKPDIATTVPNQRTTTAAPPVPTHPSISPGYKTPQTSSKVEKWKNAGIVAAVILPLIVIILVIYFLMEKYFRIHTNYEHLIQKAHNETVTLEAYVPWFSCFDIEFQWKLIKNEDDINEEIDLPENGRFQVNSDVRSRSTLTISSITVQDEAEYVCRANLKCWKRIADRYATKLIVKGGDSYTPMPSPKLEQKDSPETGNSSETPLYGKSINVVNHSDQTILGNATFNTFNITNYVRDADDDEEEGKYYKKKKPKKPKKRRNSSSSLSEELPLIERKPQKHFSLEEEKENLDILAKSKLQIRIDDVPGDGNCLYHALLRNKNIHNLPDNPQELRRQLVKFLESNPVTPDGTSYKDFLCLPRDPDHGDLDPEDMAIERVENVENQKELRWQRFLEKVQGEEWGGSIEILALAQLYNVPITVLSCGMDGFNLRETKFNHTLETSLNPVIYLGHLKENGRGLHFVAFKPLEERTFEQTMELPGEQHRKTIDSSYLYREGNTLYKSELSCCIGCIWSGDDRGTGFRVGSKYVMTAFHVVGEILKQFWEEVFMRLTESEKCAIHWTEKNVPQDGRWSLTDLLQTLENPEKQEKLKEIGLSITGKLEICFSFVENNKNGKEIPPNMFSYDVAFASPVCDVVILELLGNEKDLPKPISLNSTNLSRIQEKLHIIGHPNGMELQHDPGCKIIKKKEELNELVKDGIEFFSSQGYDKTEVEEDYKPCVISPDHILFHCSQSTAHGASGSPLIVISDDQPQVTGMLLRGHPKLYYNYKKGKDKERPDLLVESGISMEKVHSLLKEHELDDLAADLFS